MEKPSNFQGTLEQLRVPEILCHLSRKNETGTLLIQRQHQEKKIFFEDGRIVFAVSNDADQSFGVFLLRQNKVTYSQLQKCAPKVEPGKRLGTILVLDGVIQPNDLYQGVIDQIKEIIYSIFDWEAGQFHFQSGPLPQKEVITLNLSTPSLILTGMQRVWRWSWIRKALPSLDTVYRKCEGWSPVVRKMSLTRETESVLDLFDRPRMLGEVLQISELGNFETCRILWSFIMLGIIEEILVAPVWEESPSREATTGSGSTQEMNPAAAEPTVVSPAVESPPVNVPGVEPQPIINTAPAQDLEPLLADPAPYSELSFSDLAELTESEAREQDKSKEPEQKPSVEQWELAILPEIQKLNELHRYIFEMISLELGNSTNTFLSKVFKKASIRYPLVFESVSINDFGELNESILLANIQGNLVRDYQKAFDFLISEERSTISLFLEMKRVNAIEAGIKRILERRNQVVL